MLLLGVEVVVESGGGGGGGVCSAKRLELIVVQDFELWMMIQLEEPNWSDSFHCFLIHGSRGINIYNFF